MERKMNKVFSDGYNSPELEIIEISVEKGFASSPGNEGVGEEEGEGSFN